MNGRNDSPGSVADAYERYMEHGSGSHAPASDDNYEPEDA